MWNDVRKENQGGHVAGSALWWWARRAIEVILNLEKRQETALAARIIGQIIFLDIYDV